MVCCAGRLARGPQPVLLSDGSTTGPISYLVPLCGARGKAAAGAAVGTAPESDVARSFFFQDGTPGALDGLFAVGALSGVFICRALPDQRLQQLHTVMPPAGIREDAPPYVAWQTVQHDADGCVVMREWGWCALKIPWWTAVVGSACVCKTLVVFSHKYAKPWLFSHKYAQPWFSPTRWPPQHHEPAGAVLGAPCGGSAGAGGCAQ